MLPASLQTAQRLALCRELPMSSVAPYSHERGHLINVRSRHWIVNGIYLNTLPSSILSPIFNPPDKLGAFFGSIRSGAAFTADVRISRSCFCFGIENEDDLPRLLAVEELPPELRAVRVVAIPLKDCIAFPGIKDGSLFQKNVRWVASWIRWWIWRAPA